MTPDVTSPRPPASPRSRWRLWLTIGFGLLLPLTFATVLVWLILTSGAPWWALGVGALLGFAYATFQRLFRCSPFYSEKIYKWTGAASGLLLAYTERIVAHAVPHHSAPLAFFSGYFAAFIVGLFLGFLPLSVETWKARRVSSRKAIP